VLSSEVNSYTNVYHVGCNLGLLTRKLILSKKSSNSIPQNTKKFRAKVEHAIPFSKKNKPLFNSTPAI
jgi:hypothetical protein